MTIRSQVFCAAAVAACVGALPSVAGAEDAFPRSSVGFLGPADQVWQGSARLPACAPRASALAPRNRAPDPQSRGEVIAEFSSPITPTALSQARRCAASAGDEATSLLMLTGGAPAFSRFRSAFAACMAKSDQPTAVGSMTLWVDHACNW